MNLMILWVGSRLPFWLISILRVAELIDMWKILLRAWKCNPTKALVLLMSRAIIDLYPRGVGGDVVDWFYEFCLICVVDMFIFLIIL